MNESEVKPKLIIPFDEFKIRATSLLIVKNYLSGTDSDEWLKLAEDRTYKKIKQCQS